MEPHKITSTYFVFNDRRKVKLVRIPEGFKVVEGEKLDPCVEKLIKTIDKDKLHSIIGVVHKILHNKM